METKPLAFAIIGFLLGGLVVSIAATQQDDAPSGGGHGSAPVGAPLSE